MSETGKSWQVAVAGHPREAARLRAWVRLHLAHGDAPLIAHEMFAAILTTRPDTVEVTLSTAGARARIVAQGPRRLPALATHGPGWTILHGLAERAGTTVDHRGLWAHLPQEDTPA